MAEKRTHIGGVSVLVIAAFAVVYLVWGSTYLANLWAIQDIPPFLMAGLRFLLAGSILFTWMASRGQRMPRWRDWRNAGILGIGFLSLGTGGVVWAEQYIDSAMAALMVSSEPLLVLFLLWGIDKSRPGWWSWLGVLIGMTGTFLLVGQPHLVADRNTVLGMIAIFIALTAWGVASIYASRLQLPKSRLQASAMQMLVGGAVLVLLGSFTGEWQRFDIQAIGLRSWGAWLYLVVFGSLLAFSCFNYLLTQVSPEKVATSTYVHPVVALLLGWGLNDELITGQSLLAGSMMLLGVFFINR